ncbi:DUF1826 domain-containing protein [Pseudomonas urmiensis]|uniref:DUF1826 domain-containing protein n=1 Tax=Pseudomonas urmiensis TaxID=2745493 RepID=UPI003D1046F4
MNTTRTVDISQVFGQSPQVLAEILQDGVNLAAWQRRLPAQVEDFSTVLLSLDPLLADERVLDVDERHPPQLPGLLPGAADLHGYESFVADVAWLVAAYTCLLGARRIGLRLRVLEGAMCPRFHVDKVPLRLLTTYTGAGSEWLKEEAIDRGQLQPLSRLWITFSACRPVRLQYSRARSGWAMKGQGWCTAHR